MDAVFSEFPKLAGADKGTPGDAALSHSTSLGARLRDARTAIGLTLKEASASIGLAISTISELEADKRKVSAVELHRFAVLYQRPIDFFFEGNDSSAPFAVLLRAADSVSVPKKTVIQFHELCRRYRDLNKLTGAPEMPGPPDYSGLRPGSLEQAEELAEAERSSLGLDGQPIKDIYDLLEAKRGIKIFHLPEESGVLSGAFAYDDKLGACFLINSVHPQRRRVFTVAHEYAHCIAHRNQLAHIDAGAPFGTRNPRERFANAFAAAFLMPRRAISEALSQLMSKNNQAITREVIVRLAVYFGVSFEAAGWRLVSLRKLPLTDWEKMLGGPAQSSPAARLLGYYREREAPEMLPRHYKYLAYEAYRTKLISLERLAELLHRNYYELREEFSRGDHEDAG